MDTTISKIENLVSLTQNSVFMNLMKLLLGLPILIFCLSCSSNAQEQPTDSKDIDAGFQAPIIFEEYGSLAPYFERQNDTTYVINFWATWCGPCVKELPYFEQLHNTYADKKVKLLLVSLDFPDQIEKKLIPFLKDKQLKSEVVALIDSDMNSWIPKVSDEWSGAIPATVIYNKSKRAFYEQSFDSFDELNNILKPFLN